MTDEISVRQMASEILELTNDRENPAQREIHIRAQAIIDVLDQSEPEWNKTEARYYPNTRIVYDPPREIRTGQSCD